MLALWGRLWSRLGCRFWNGFRLLPWDKTVINNIFGEVKRPLKHVAKARIPMSRRTNTCGGHLFTDGPEECNSHVSNSDMGDD